MHDYFAAHSRGVETSQISISTTFLLAPAPALPIGTFLTVALAVTVVGQGPVVAMLSSCVHGRDARLAIVPPSLLPPAGPIRAAGVAAGGRARIIAASLGQLPARPKAPLPPLLAGGGDADLGLLGRRGRGTPARGAGRVEEAEQALVPRPRLILLRPGHLLLHAPVDHLLQDVGVVRDHP
jgi:hypothetical protein